MKLKTVITIKLWIEVVKEIVKKGNINLPNSTQGREKFYSLEREDIDIFGRI